MIVDVKFYWCGKEKIWSVRGRNIADITEKCHTMCEKYHAIHFEVLDNLL